MSEDLDTQTLALVARILDSHPEDALLIRRLWKDRTLLIDAMGHIRDWDMMSAQARSLVLVDKIVATTLEKVEE